MVGLKKCLEFRAEH